MTKVDLRIEYHKDTGKAFIDAPKNEMDKFDIEELQEYTKWLEDYILAEFNLFKPKV